MKRIGKVLCTAAVVASGLAFTPHPASALVPHNCPLSAGQAAVQTCIEDPGYSEAHLTGTATWTLDAAGSVGLTVYGGKPPVFLDANASINARYTSLGSSYHSATVVVQGGDFTMQPGSKITNQRTTGLPTFDDTNQWKRRGVWVRGDGTALEDGSFTMDNAQVLAGGSAVWVAGAVSSGSQSVVIKNNSIIWGYQGLAGGADVGERHSVAIVDSTIVGMFFALSLEPESNNRGYFKANIHDNLFSNPNDGNLAFVAVNPYTVGSYPCPAAVLTSLSGIHNNSGTGSAQVNPLQTSNVSANSFSFSTTTC